MRSSLAALLLLLCMVWLAALAAALDLEDLNVDSDRLRHSDNNSRWKEPWSIPSTTTWTVYNVTDYGVWSGGGQQCSLTDTLTYNDITCIDSAVSAANSGGGDGAVLYFPAGTYNITAQDEIHPTRSNWVYRCEDPTTTTIKFEDESNGLCADNSDAPLCLGSGGDTANVETWTAGFTDDTTVLTVADGTDFAVGEYIRANMAWASGGDCMGGRYAGREPTFAHVAKIIAKDGNNLTIDRPLRMNYTWPESCGAKTVTELSWNANVGLENCNVRYADRNYGGIDEYTPLIAVERVVGAWVTGNHIEETQTGVRLRQATNVVVEGNYFENVNELLNNPSGDPPGDTVDVQRAVSDAWIINNIFDKVYTMVYLQQGPEGIVIAHNFEVPPLSVGLITKGKTSYHHGGYTREILTEANDFQGNPKFDTFWGPQGPKNTMYRNRLWTDNETYGGDPQRNKAEGLWFNTHVEAEGDYMCDHPTLIANHTEWFMLHGGGETPLDPATGWADYVYEDYISNLHFEFNYAAHYITMNTINPSINCGSGSFSPSSSPVDCIPGICSATPRRFCNEDSDCNPDTCTWPADAPSSMRCINTSTLPVTDCAESSNYHGRNYEADGSYTNGPGAPAGWTQTIPDSLYLTEAPDWWCQEACAFDQTGIGAFGDKAGRCYTGGVTPTNTFCRYDIDCPSSGDTCEDADFCKLPAQIRYEGGVCSGMGGQGHAGGAGGGGVF